METVISRDGTTIAFEAAGSGPPLILVGGMFEQRAMASETAQLAASPLLAERFTVVHYDRRGRGDSGDSGDTASHALEREIEDIAALIERVGGAAFVFGISSGAALALEAALALGENVRRLAIYEPPYNDAPEARGRWRSFRAELRETLAAGRNDAAVELIMSLMGVPAEQLAEMHGYPMWPMWRSIAPTIGYDAAALGEEAAVPIERAAGLATPTLVVAGEQSFPWMHTSAEALAAAIPHARLLTLPGQTHEVEAEALAPALAAFFTAP